MHDAQCAIPAYGRSPMDERANQGSLHPVRPETAIAPPPSPLLQDTVQRLEAALCRVGELTVRVRSAKHSVFGASPRGPGGETGAVQPKEPVLGDIVRNQTSALHRLLSELEEETSQLINQLL